MDQIQQKLENLSINADDTVLLKVDNSLEEDYPVVYFGIKQVLRLGICNGSLTKVSLPQDCTKYTYAYIKASTDIGSRAVSPETGTCNRVLLNFLMVSDTDIEMLKVCINVPKSIKLSIRRFSTEPNTYPKRLHYSGWKQVRFSDVDDFFLMPREDFPLCRYFLPLFYLLDEQHYQTRKVASNESTYSGEYRSSKTLNNKIERRLVQKLQLLKSVQLSTSSVNQSSGILPKVVEESSSIATLDSLADVGGYIEVKALLLEAINSAIQPHNSKFGVDPVKGILLYGPPGCSKTLIAKTISSKAGMNFFSIKGPEIFSKWVGDSERRLKEIFIEARKNEPSVLFIDEIDSIAKVRGAYGSSVDMRVLSQLLTEIDGMNSHSSSVIVIGATNRPDIMDPAILRPGRLDRHIYVSLPSQESIRDIIQLLINRFKISVNLPISELTPKLDGYSGAEIVAIFQDAAYLCLKEKRREISFNQLLSCITFRKPDTQPNLLKYYENFQQRHY